MALWTPRVRLERPSYFRLGGYGVQWAVSETDIMATWRGDVATCCVMCTYYV